ncbi:MAG: hypothetical protein JWM15_2255, partial [Cryptosporangiaceae bacterium]|nr:hypothetical protein [Cryptosporangiaceae bacterium]
VRGPGAAPSRPASRPASRPVEWSTRMPRPDPVRTLTPSKGGDRQDHGADAEDQKDKQSRKKAKETEGGKDDD